MKMKDNNEITIETQISPTEEIKPSVEKAG